MKKKLKNFIIHFKNATFKKKEIIIITYSEKKLNFIKHFYNEGFIQGYNILIKNNKYYINIYIRYLFNNPILQNIKLLAKKSKKLNIKKKELYKLPSKRISHFISTNHGLKSLINCKKENSGGILLLNCY